MKGANGLGERLGRRILIVGTGGQGVLTAARVLCDCLVAQGRHVVSGQLHGMAQRGGSVQASIVVNSGISPVIGSGRADCVLGLEPVETARALPLMSAHTAVYMNTAPVIPYVLAQRTVLSGSEARYPDVEKLAECIRAATPHVFTFDATRRAAEAGSGRALNMLMLGCLLGSGSCPCATEEFWDCAVEMMPRALREANTRAFAAGVELGKSLRMAEARP